MRQNCKLLGINRLSPTHTVIELIKLKRIVVYQTEWGHWAALP